MKKYNHLTLPLSSQSFVKTTDVKKGEGRAAVEVRSSYQSFIKTTDV